MNNTKWIAIALSSLVGILINNWAIIANMVGYTATHSAQSPFSMEYLVSIVAAFLLGFVFARYPTYCGISLMAAPIAINHVGYFWQHGVPSLWPMELLILAVFTIPYIVAAFGGSKIRTRYLGSE